MLRTSQLSGAPSRANVRIRVQTKSREYVVDENLTQTRVEIERIGIGRPVDVAPPMRVEGDTTVISVVERNRRGRAPTRLERRISSAARAND